MKEIDDMQEEEILINRKGAKTMQQLNSKVNNGGDGFDKDDSIFKN